MRWDAAVQELTKENTALAEMLRRLIRPTRLDRQSYSETWAEAQKLLAAYDARRKETRIHNDGEE